MKLMKRFFVLALALVFAMGAACSGVKENGEEKPAAAATKEPAAAQTDEAAATETPASEAPEITEEPVPEIDLWSMELALRLEELPVDPDGNACFFSLQNGKYITSTSREPGGISCIFDPETGETVQLSFAPAYSEMLEDQVRNRIKKAVEDYPDRLPDGMEVSELDSLHGIELLTLGGRSWSALRMFYAYHYSSGASLVLCRMNSLGSEQYFVLDQYSGALYPMTIDLSETSRFTAESCCDRKLIGKVTDEGSTKAAVFDTDSGELEEFDVIDASGIIPENEASSFSLGSVDMLSDGSIAAVVMETCRDAEAQPLKPDHHNYYLAVLRPDGACETYDLGSFSVRNSGGNIDCSVVGGDPNVFVIWSRTLTGFCRIIDRVAGAARTLELSDDGRLISEPIPDTPVEKGSFPNGKIMFLGPVADGRSLMVYTRDCYALIRPDTLEFMPLDGIDPGEFSPFEWRSDMFGSVTVRKRVEDSEWEDYRAVLYDTAHPDEPLFAKGSAQ